MEKYRLFTMHTTKYISKITKINITKIIKKYIKFMIDITEISRTYPNYVIQPK